MGKGIFNKMVNIVLYLVLLLPSLIVVSILWSIIHNLFLFRCTDWFPISDLIPPFVHGAQYGDYYIAPEPVVFVIWGLFIGLIFILPLLAIPKLKHGQIK